MNTNRYVRKAALLGLALILLAGCGTPPAEPAAEAEIAEEPEAPPPAEPQPRRPNPSPPLNRPLNRRCCRC